MSTLVDILINPVTLRFSYHNKELIYMFASNPEQQLDEMEKLMGVTTNDGPIFDTNVGFLPVATTTLIRGEKTILIDPGNYHIGFYSILKRALASKNLTYEDIDIIATTHTHSDHAASIVHFRNKPWVIGNKEFDDMEAIEGKRSTPRFKPPFPAASGLWKKPTNINNVKTISYVPEIIKNGSDWFKSTGTEKSTGTAIVCLTGHINRPGMYEIPMGMTIEDVLGDIGGGSSSSTEIKMLQTGGPLGGVLGKEAFATKIDFDEMAKSGAILGSGGIIVCDESVSVVDLIRNLVAFNQFESCGKCFPCRLGNTHMYDVLDRLCNSSSKPNDLELLERIGKSMKIGSLCGHGQLGYNPISSSLKYFENEIIDSINNKLEPLEKMLTPTRTRPSNLE